MDSTLLGALVGGGCAVAGAACTSVATYFSNKHAERTKIRIQKKRSSVSFTIDNKRLFT